MLIKNEPVHDDSPPIISLSAHSIQGKRNHMEDFFDIGYQMKPLDQRTANPNQWPFEYFYFGIFDGHGGSEAACYAKRHLLKFITKQADFWSSDDEDVKRAISNGFAQTHAAMRREMHSWPRTSRVLPSTAGTTASVVFIRNGKFFTGHVGDTRIVISHENPETKQWISRQLTVDHKPESRQESERIQRAGGEVKSKIGVHRVVWKRPILVGMQDCIYDHQSAINSEQYKNYTQQITTYPVTESFVESYQIIPFLAIARSLGDFWSINPYSGQYIVSPEPDVECRPITTNDKCILLATDGLWNVMNSTQAVRMLQELNILKSGESEKSCKDEYFSTDNFYDVAGHDSENHAQSLVYFAYQLWERRRLRSDNITVVVAMLHDILNYHQPNTKLSMPPEASHENLRNTIDNFCVKKELHKAVVQLGQTSTFTEKIGLNKEPKFFISDKAESNSCSNRWRRLESFLVLPPTILEQEYHYTLPKLVYPRNYLRLSNAECKRIPLYYHRSDPFIYIKHVSDDPADALVNPSRLNKSGKEVRDASAQATQSIHDFGQPWDQLLDDDIDSDEDLVMYKRRSYGESSDEEDEETRTTREYLLKTVFGNDDSDSDESSIHHDEDEELVFEHELRDEELLENYEKDDSDSDDTPLDNDDDEELVFEHELREEELRRIYEKDDSDSDDTPLEEQFNQGVITKDETKEVESSQDEVSLKNKDKKNIPQLRCLLNYTSPLRRSTRNSYMSLSDNSKRKSQINSNTTIPKSKRRKSQPVRCNSSKA